MGKRDAETECVFSVKEKGEVLKESGKKGGGCGRKQEVDEKYVRFPDGGLFGSLIPGGAEKQAENSRKTAHSSKRGKKQVWRPYKEKRRSKLHPGKKLDLRARDNRRGRKKNKRGILKGRGEDCDW